MINGFIDVISIGNNNNNNSSMYTQEEKIFSLDRRY